jgi:putative DeoR family transcriptional regulator (stage III sporulation protein D)
MEDDILNYDITNRVLDEATYMVNTKNTIREIAKVFGVSKSTVHKDLKERLKYVDDGLHNEVKQILWLHKETRHLRGGESTRKKYLKKDK